MRRRGSVSVPVLSMQSVSTEASDSTAFSCCASAPRRARASAAAAYVIDISSTRPSGIKVTIPATAVVDRLPHVDVLLPERDDEHRPQRHHRGDEDVEKPVDGSLERRARVTELARLPAMRAA